MRITMRIRWTLVLALAFAVAGCVPEEEETVVVDEETAEPTPARPSTAGEPPAGAADVRVDLAEWAIEMDRDTVPAGPTTFAVENRGDVVHAFEVEGNGMEWETEEIPPGGSTTLMADLPPGSYEVYCPVVGDQGTHRELGMRGTLVVR